MAKNIILRPMKEWGEKEGKRVLTSIRIYIGKVHVATVSPDRLQPDMYFCHCMYDIIRVETKRQRLEDIKSQIELSLKEFINSVTLKFEV